MSVNATHGVNGTTKATVASYVKNKDGSITINFRGKPQKISGKDAERYTETFAKVYAVPMKIAEIEGKLADPNISAKEKTKLTTELKDLKQKAAEQRAAANIEISPDGKNVYFTLKKNINVEKFKELFNIETGTFREHLTKVALQDGVNVSKRPGGSALSAPFASYDEARDALGGFRDGKPLEFSNGVKLVPTTNPDGEELYCPDYTGCSLYRGTTFDINEDCIDDGKPWYQFW